MNRNEREAGHRELERRKHALAGDLFRLINKQSRKLREISEVLIRELEEIDDKDEWDAVERFLMAIGDAGMAATRAEGIILKRGK